MHRFRLLVSAAVLALLPAAGVLADGAFVWRKGVDLNEPSQKAILYWLRGREVMILQVKYEGPAEDFGWLVPLPARPEVEAIKPEDSPFAEISRYTQRRLRWGLRSMDEAGGKDAVTVLERKVAGVYDVAVLAADDAGALAGWLQKHGFAFPRERQDVLDHYVRKRWVYVAMRIDPKQLGSDEVRKLRTGELQPVRFAFPARRMVYPLRISSVNAGQTEVLLYLLADWPMVPAAGPGQGFDVKVNCPDYRTDWNVDPRYGTYRKAEGRELPKTWKALGVRQSHALHLMKYRALYTGATMTDDLAFAPMDTVAYWKRQLEESGDDLFAALQAARVLAANDPAYGRRVAEIMRLIEKARREAEARRKAERQEALRQSARSPDPKVRAEVARNTDTGEALLRTLAHDAEASVRAIVATRRDLPADLLEQLAEDPDRTVRLAVARNGEAPIALRARITIRDETVDRRGSIALYSRSEEALLPYLASDPSTEVRRHLARNSHASEAALRQLAADPEPAVRAAVAENSSTPNEVRWRLGRDAEPSVRLALVRHCTPPVDLQQTLAGDVDWHVRAAVAKNPMTAEATVRRLARDAEPQVRMAAAENPRAPADLLRQLTEDRDMVVRCAVGRNLRSPEAVLGRLARDKRYEVRGNVASNPKAPADVLRALAVDEQCTVRHSLAYNPAAPVDVLRRLLEDEDSRVVEGAQAMLKKRDSQP